MDISIVIPCFNEEENILKIQRELFPVVDELAKSGSVEVVFVDDGSSDQTWKMLSDTFKPQYAPAVTVKIMRHDINKGLGAAIRTGFSVASGQLIVTTDSDGTYHFSEILNLVACLAPGVDIVTASPYHPAGGVENVPGYRLVLSRGASILYRLLVNRHLCTYTALFRVYRRSVIENVPFEADGYLAGTELLVNSILMGYRVAEYPTVLHSRAFGASKARLARTTLAHLKYQARVLHYRLSPQSFRRIEEASGGKI